MARNMSEARVVAAWKRVMKRRSRSLEIVSRCFVFVLREVCAGVPSLFRSTWGVFERDWREDYRRCRDGNLCRRTARALIRRPPSDRQPSASRWRQIKRRRFCHHRSRLDSSGWRRLRLRRPRSETLKPPPPGGLPDDTPVTDVEVNMMRYCATQQLLAGATLLAGQECGQRAAECVALSGNALGVLANIAGFRESMGGNAPPAIAAWVATLAALGEARKRKLGKEAGAVCITLLGLASLQAFIQPKRCYDVYKGPKASGQPSPSSRSARRINSRQPPTSRSRGEPRTRATRRDCSSRCSRMRLRR